MEVKDVFLQFLLGYVSNRATVNQEAMNELFILTEDYINNLFSDYYFDEITLIDYLETLNDNLRSKNKGFFKLQYRRRDYIALLEQYIKKLIENPTFFKENHFINNDENEKNEEEN